LVARLSYGNNFDDPLGRSALYIDRILKDAKLDDPPVVPTENPVRPRASRGGRIAWARGNPTTEKPRNSRRIPLMPVRAKAIV
jgi:hypothetical protein